MPGPLSRIPFPARGQQYRAPPSLEAATAAAAHIITRRREADKPKGTTIAIAAIVGGIIVLLAVVIVTRTLRSRHPNPKYIPTPFLKRLWTDWNVPPYNNRPTHAYEPTRNSTTEDDISRRQTRTTQDTSLTYPSQTLGRTGATNAASGGAGVDRNTSVRSVMTLPVYRPRAAETEQVLGREGERDGIDVVVEMPTAEEEEALREEEMNALYQIRLTRRQQIAEREERRRLRREARENNDVLALQELRNQTRNSAGRNNDVIQELRDEHERIREAARQRGISSVSYADLGVARADGTRIRANSTESERVGLLSDAASIGRNRPLSGSAAAGGDSLQHRRDRSSSSIISIDTARSNTDLAPESPSILTGGPASSTFSLTTSNSSIGMGRARSNSHSRSGLNTPRAGSSPEMIDSFEATGDGRSSGDLGDLNMPPPPDYETVSLGDITPGISGRNSPYDEPPPEYPGGRVERIQDRRLSARMEGLAISQLSAARSRGNSPMPSPAVPLTPMRLPQIVIDPASGNAR